MCQPMFTFETLKSNHAPLMTNIFVDKLPPPCLKQFYSGLDESSLHDNFIKSCYRNKCEWIIRKRKCFVLFL